MSYAERNARERIAALLDAGSFQEWLGPAQRATSPHLALLGLPAAFDDGVVIGRARVDGRPVLVAAQEGAFLGGGVGEVHGAKLTGLLLRALRERPAAVLLLAESGGVRLHEANAGLIAVSEVMRAVLEVRAAGIPVLVLIGGANGCFGGMGIVARCADTVVMSELGRLAMSGPEVIEASHGVEEFDARDRALVWRTTGGKHRFQCGDCDLLVEDEVQAFRAAAIERLSVRRPFTVEALEQEHTLLAHRLAQAPGSEFASPPGGGRKWARVAEALFGPQHEVRAEGDLLHGSAAFEGREFTVVGTTGHAPIGVALALAQARVVLDTMARLPGRPILLLVDTQGQQLRRRDELLGINRVMAHLGCCIDLARRRGHRVLGLVYDQALSGGFLASGLIADACYALPEAEIRVMRIPAMSRVTHIPEARLEELSASNPVFAPGVGNFVAMGGVQAIWDGELRDHLREALAHAPVRDERAQEGAVRGGRRLAAEIIERVLTAE